MEDLVKIVIIKQVRVDARDPKLRGCVRDARHEGTRARGHVKHGGI